MFVKSKGKDSEEYKKAMFLQFHLLKMAPMNDEEMDKYLANLKEEERKEIYELLKIAFDEGEKNGK